MCRIGDVPHRHRRLVDATHRHVSRVRRPPEAAVAVHLFGGHELGRAPTHRVGFVEQCRSGQLETVFVVPLRRDHAQRTTTHVRHPSAVGRESRVEHRPDRADLAHVHLVQIAHEQSSRQGAHEARAVGVGGITGDTAGTLAQTLAARAFLGWQFLGVVGSQHDVRIGHHRLVSGFHVEQPESVHGVVAGVAAQVHHLASVVGHGDVARFAQGESLGARVLLREGIGAHRFTSG